MQTARSADASESQIFVLVVRYRPIHFGKRSFCRIRSLDLEGYSTAMAFSFQSLLQVWQWQGCFGFLQTLQFFWQESPRSIVGFVARYVDAVELGEDGSHATVDCIINKFVGSYIEYVFAVAVRRLDSSAYTAIVFVAGLVEIQVGAAR